MQRHGVSFGPSTRWCRMCRTCSRDTGSARSSSLITVLMSLYPMPRRYVVPCWRHTSRCMEHLSGPLWLRPRTDRVDEAGRLCAGAHGWYAGRPARRRRGSVLGWCRCWRPAVCVRSRICTTRSPSPLVSRRKPGQRWRKSWTSCGVSNQPSPISGSAYTCYPGTPIAARALAEGRITDEADLLKPTVYLPSQSRTGSSTICRQRSKNIPVGTWYSASRGRPGCLVP